MLRLVAWTLLDARRSLLIYRPRPEAVIFCLSQHDEGGVVSCQRTYSDSELAMARHPAEYANDEAERLIRELERGLSE